MKLIVNGPAVLRSSFGVRRYYESVMQHLDWPGAVSVTPIGPSRILDRVSELCARGYSDAVLWSPCQRGPLNAKRHVVTVHDCINLEYVYADDWRRSALKWASQRLLSNADIVVTISNATRNAVLRNYQLDPSSVIVIRSPSRVELHEKNGEFEIDHAPERFVLMVTNSLPHKNTAFACRALIAAGIQRRGIALRVVGSLSPEALSLCRDANIQFTVSKNVADAQLRHWYKNSLFLLSPSLDEGHNLPIAEALSLGANVLCSDIAVHREFYDGCVKFFPPTDLPAATRAVESAIEDGGTWKFNLPQTKRSFVEVAAEYKRVFSSIYEAERK